MTLERLVILNPSPVILNEVKNLRAGSVKDLWQNGPLPEPHTDVSNNVPEVTGQNENPVKKGEVEGQLILGRVR
jgi:hypothetical protein